nr:MAG TPA: helix-turn-helix domain protein [Caudoviricetes sp.]
MSKERMVQVTKDEYENLIRDQHTVELLTGYVQKQGWMTDSMLCLLLGIQEPKHELPPGWDPEPGSETVTADISLPVPAMEEALRRKSNLPPSAEPEKKSGRKKIDRGKVLALHRAGWSNKKIADEMACSEASISIILKEESGKYN